MSRIYVKTIYALCGKYINSSLTWVLMRFCNATFHNKVVQQVSVTLLWAFETHRQAKKNSHSLIKRCPQFVCLFLFFFRIFTKTIINCWSSLLPGVLSSSVSQWREWRWHLHHLLRSVDDGRRAQTRRSAVWSPLRLHLYPALAESSEPFC